MTHRRTIVAGNWKMNLDRAKARDLAAAVATRAAEAGTTELVLCPPAVYVETVAAALGGSSPVALGAQNMHDQSSGAFTGEVAPQMLLDLGCRYVILGHSERRTLFGETDAVVNAKTRAALAAGLTPIVCVGETLEEREGGRTAAVVTTQVQGSLAGLTSADLETIVVAYEPVWAIGTGRTATPQQAQDAHAFIRRKLTELWDAATADKVRIQYGGSVKPANTAELMGQPDIDGALVGGASLDPRGFAEIVLATVNLAR
jgi:triosephosphate isomerase